MRTVIFANGEMSRLPDIRPDDLLIAADGGARHCLVSGLCPAFVIGDLDSLSDSDLHTLEARGARILRYPVRKDYTDLELAFQHARELGAQEVLLAGGLGARWDQTIANLLLASSFPGLRISLMDGNQEFHFIRSGERLELHGQAGDSLSLIPMCGDAIGITTTGLEYPLNGETLAFGSTRGVSNVLLDDQPAIFLQEGLLLCVLTHQDT